MVHGKEIEGWHDRTLYTDGTSKFSLELKTLVRHHVNYQTARSKARNHLLGYHPTTVLKQ